MVTHKFYVLQEDNDMIQNQQATLPLVDTTLYGAKYVIWDVSIIICVANIYLYLYESWFQKQEIIFFLVLNFYKCVLVPINQYWLLMLYTRFIY